MFTVLNVAGARPNFMKIAPLMRAMSEHGGFAPKLIHTGQHYDAAMSAVFFRDLGIPEPDMNLEVGSGSRLEQIRRIMARFEPLVRDARPDLVLVVGDVNSTIACARVARECGVPVAHVEAGLRSFDESMPEEINRIETDTISDLLFVTEPSGMTNLANERVMGKAFLVGNVMIDSLMGQLDRARSRHKCRLFGLRSGDYFVATFHRPSNVDDPSRLANVLEIIEYIASLGPIVLPLHPRTRKALEAHRLSGRLEANPNVRIVEPLGYVDFLSLICEAKGVVTDSGGIQEEATYLRIPCVTMRDNTERPITVEVGSNILAGTRPAGVIAAVSEVLRSGSPRGSVPALWDGHAAERIVEILAAELAAGLEIGNEQA